MVAFRSSSPAQGIGPADGAVPHFGPAVGLRVPNGDYVYTEASDYLFGPDWVAHPGVWGELYQHATWFSPADASGRETGTANYGVPGGGNDVTYGPGDYVGDTGDLSYLSLDPTTLAEQLRVRTAPNGASPEPYQDWAGPGPDGHVTAGLVRAIGELLLDGNATPELKAALFHVLVGLDGAVVDETATDPVGRPAVEVSIDTEGRLHHLWFDAVSQQLMARTDGSGADQETLIMQRAGVVAATDSTKLTSRFMPDATTAPSAP